MISNGGRFDETRKAAEAAILPKSQPAPLVTCAYLTEQIRLLIENHGVPVEIGESSEPIPIHFAYRRDINIEAVLSAAKSCPSTDRCATCSTRPISPPWTTRSLTAL